MVFVILFLLLSGAALVFSGIENVSLSAYIQKWVTGSATA